MLNISYDRLKNELKEVRSYKLNMIKEDNKKKKEIWEWIKIFKKAYNNSICLFPGCENKRGVNCHSISKTKHLNVIAKDGHVYRTKILPDKIMNKNRKPYLEGIGKVSIFQGLCSEHDGSIFKSIDNDAFESSLEQLYLLAYRTYLFQLRFIITDNIAEKGGNEVLDAQLQTTIAWKNEFEQVYCEKNYDIFKSYVIEFKNIPTILTAIPLYMPFDLNGEDIIVKMDEHPARPFMYINILPHSDSGGYATFTWHRTTNEFSKKFIDSLHSKPNELITDFLIKIFFAYFGNLVICPMWWEELERKKRDYLEGLFATAILGNMDLAWELSLWDGFEISDWEIIKKGYIN